MSVSATSMPRSPRTRLWRRFVGVSQSTMQLNGTSERSRPVTSTRSSCSRPMRCAVWAASVSTGDPPSQRTRSRSCVARSFTTPTSRTRSGNGPTRSVAIRIASPTSVAALAQREQRRVEALDVPDGGVDARGLHGRDDLPGLLRRRRERLLHEQVHPAPRQLTCRARCSSVGTATIAKSGRPRSSSSATVVWIAPASRDRAVAVPSGVDRAREHDARGCLQQPRVVAADHARARARRRGARGLRGRRPRAARVPPNGARPLRASSSPPARRSAAT